MIRWTVLFLVLLTGVSLHAQNIALSGKVTNQSGKAIYGAIVSLKSKQIKDTTDASGAYSLIATVSGVSDMTIHSIKKSISMKNGIISVHLTKPAQLSVEFFNMNGKLLNKFLDNHVSAGAYQFKMKKLPSAQNMVLVRISIDRHTECFSYIPQINGCNVSAAEVTLPGQRLLSKIQAAVDSLQASALGYKTKIVPVSSFEEKIDIVLENEDVGECTPSKTVNMTVSGSGTHKVTVETNSDPGIKEGTIYRPTDLGGDEKYPIFAWGEGGCSQNGKSNSAAMAEIASHGYFVIADGTPDGSGSRSMNTSDPVSMGKPLLAYITWAIAQNKKPCSPYYQSLDTTKIATNGFSCGGLMAEGTAGDKRITTWGLTSSGLFAANQAFYKTVHTPVLMVEGGSSDMAYENGGRDYQNISALGIPIMWFSKNIGHGGDLSNKNGGDFTKINLAWLNWWLKGDEGATGKGVLVGSGCKYCTDNAWEVKSANFP
ncbi:MAG TPA: carboxypeptidase-like regulatory domain-containing protein [Chitinispirillaceae bacterium]|nr:carboxypeptidase-like regulatory domain-containing protein [Chitinispirillaceae bacterium]